MDSGGPQLRRQRVPFCSQTARPTAAGFGIGIAHGCATIGFEGLFDYAAIGTVSNVASRLCEEAKPGQILSSPRVLTKVENAVKVEPVGEFELKGIRRPLAAYNVVAASPSKV
jgi:adenylate cyclase